MRQVSDIALDFIKDFEGFEAATYTDIAGVPTIGYGHTGSAAFPGNVISQAQAETYLRQDSSTAAQAVDLWVKVPLNENERAALVSFTYNLGSGSLKRSTLLKKLNNNDRAGAAQEFLKWNKARISGVLKPIPGLTRRRAMEKALFLKKKITP